MAPESIGSCLTEVPIEGPFYSLASSCPRIRNYLIKLTKIPRKVDPRGG